MRADEQLLWLEGSLPVQATPLKPLHALGEWLNVAVGLRWREQGAPELAQVKVGRVGVHPALALWVARQALAHHELLEPAELLVALEDQDALVFLGQGGGGREPADPRPDDDHIPV